MAYKRKLGQFERIHIVQRATHTGCKLEIIKRSDFLGG